MSKLTTVLFLVIVSLAPVLAQSSDGTYKGRTIANVMSYHGANWLERSDRDEEENTSLLIEKLPLTEGSRVADLGCGSGYFARRMAEQLGSAGLVYCVDIQQEMLDIASRLATDEGIENMELILGTESETGLPEGAVDLILLVDVYHELSQPGPMLASMRRALSADGVVALVEYRAEDDSAAHIKPLHRMSVEQVRKEWEPAGFVLDELIEELPTQHLFLFRRGPD